VSGTKVIIEIETPTRYNAVSLNVLTTTDIKWENNNYYTVQCYIREYK
jgi:hypothetical protein